MSEPAQAVPQESPQEGFQPLPFPCRSFVGGGASHYRVYSSATEFVSVEAETAVEALKSSGVPTPLRIQREIRGREVLIDRKRMLE